LIKKYEYHSRTFGVNNASYNKNYKRINPVKDIIKTSLKTRISIALIILIITSIACNLVKTGKPAPTGAFYCDAMEYGFLTTYPVFTVKPDGVVYDGILSKEGKWKYNSTKDSFTFSGEISFQSAEFDLQNNRWSLYILPEYKGNYSGLQFVGSDEGNIRCYLAYPDR